MNKKDALPIIIAAVIALAITLLVKFLLPGASSVPTQQNRQQEISMPEIPLMVKQNKKKKEEDYVLFVSRPFRKDAKITLENLKWEKWPAEAMQPYFIAKNHEGIPLNNGSDYSNALKMWANTDIPNGVPLTMSMLTNTDPEKKREEERKKKKEEEMKKIQKEKEEDFIKRGMRAVTFPIDQRSASATTMLKAGDLVDVLIMEQRGERTKTYKYKALKILAIDGVTKFDSTANKSQEDNGFLSNVVNVSGLMTPKNVTLEVPENLVETLLRQASSNGIILSLRSQLEKVTDTDNSNIGTATNDEFDYMLQNILDINDNDPSTIQLKEDAERKKDDDNMKMVIDNILLMNSNDEGSSFGSSNNLSGQYEIISGKVVGDDFDDSDEKTATVYRKLTPTKVEFDEYGKVSTGEKNSGN